jgi:hypothetical protein
MCLCDGNFCNLFLPALRETQPQLEFWHALILLAPVLLVLLALAATAFWALCRRRSGRYTFNPPESLRGSRRLRRASSWSIETNRW